MEIDHLSVIDDNISELGGEEEIQATMYHSVFFALHFDAKAQNRKLFYGSRRLFPFLAFRL